MGLVWAMLRGITELQRQNAVKRFEIFQAMDKRFDERDFADLRRLLDEKWLLDGKFSSYDVETKLNFAAFFEELAVSVNSKVMSKEVAFYFFGHYALTCENTLTFWEGKGMIPRDHPLWSLYGDYTSNLHGMDEQLGSKRFLKKLRFT